MRNSALKNSLLIAAVSFAALAAPAKAHGPNALSEPGYQRMRALAHELDERAQHANDQAQHQESWLYRRDYRFLRSVSNFAQQANEFHERMDNYRTAPWQVDEELRSLLRNAREVQYRASRARSADRHTLADWNAVVRLLNEMVRVYDEDVSGRAERPSDGWSGHRGRGDWEDFARRGYRSGAAADVVALARELESRAAETTSYVDQMVGVMVDPLRSIAASMRHFSNQARALRQRVESGVSGQALDANFEHLRQDADRVAAQDVAASMPDLWSRWSAVLDTLGRLEAAARH